jgi:diguanylate cyclase (GGDEF)-like protein
VSTDPSTAQPTAAGVLAEAAASLARGIDLDAAIGALIAGAARSTGAGLAALFVQDPEAGGLQLVAADGFEDAALAGFEAEVAGDPAHPIAAAARDARPDVGSVRPGLDGQPMTGAYLPLVVARDGIDLPLGVLAFGWPGERTIDDDERALLSASADLIALSLDRVRLATLVHERSEWFERLAHTDALTGLANTRLLDRVLELEVARAGRQASELSVIVFDIDDFAAFNEQAGREAGDDALRRVAATLTGSVRLVDTVARTGADEFVVVAPGSAGETVGRRLVDAVAALDEADEGVTVSAGVARFPADGTAASALLEGARRALEAAKAGGTGAIAVASTDED